MIYSLSTPACRLLIAICSLLLAGSALGASDEDKTNKVKISYDGVFIEDFTYLDGVSRTQNEAGQWQRRRLALEVEFELDRVSLVLDGGVGQGSDSFNWRDAYLFIDFPKKLELKIGKMKQKFGFSRSMSLKNNLTLERPQVLDLLNLDRASGVSLAASPENIKFEMSWFQSKNEDDELLSSTISRIVYAHEKEHYWHLGFSLARESYNGETYQVKSRAETDVMNSFLRTEKITAEKVEYQGIEGVWQRQRFMVVSELINNKIISAKEGNREYSGAYVQGSYFLTPDKHRLSDAKLRRLRLRGDSAWELVASFSYLDAFSLGDGFASSTTAIGLNYYHKSGLKIMGELNALKINQGQYDGETGLAVLLRMQFRF
ncbi:MAG: hypothetical protein COA96_14060 [SAR86 cluster bacterium]|uniref:Porin n=1 Tax=SAR86 cluster bacterium TaxID=2030880 RepID=A0A2A5ATI9_9GAMM|nr:MAG: hypothetical protein COA96_14060 [SAR86 cluster bacterium]